MVICGCTLSVMPSSDSVRLVDPGITSPNGPVNCVTAKLPKVQSAPGTTGWTAVMATLRLDTVSRPPPGLPMLRFSGALGPGNNTWDGDPEMVNEFAADAAPAPVPTSSAAPANAPAPRRRAPRAI